MNNILEICHCGCDRASHFVDDKGLGDCLSARCPCRFFVDRWDADKVGREPHVKAPKVFTCLCGHEKARHQGYRGCLQGCAQIFCDCMRYRHNEEKP